MKSGRQSPQLEIDSFDNLIASAETLESFIEPSNSEPLEKTKKPAKPTLKKNSLDDFDMKDSKDEKPLPSVKKMQASNSKDKKLKRKQYSAAKLAVLHIKRFLEDKKNFELISVTRSADVHGISDGIVFYTFKEKATDILFHVFYPARDMSDEELLKDKDEKRKLKRTDTIDLDHAITIYQQTFGQQKDAKHKLLIPVATMRKLNGVKDRDHWLELYPTGSNARLTDPQNLPFTYYDESYIKAAVTKKLSLDTKPEYTGQQGITNDKDCGPFYLANSQCSYEDRLKDRPRHITDKMYADFDAAFNEWINVNVNNTTNEKTQEQEQPIPYSRFHKFVAPEGVIDRTVALTEVTIQIAKNVVLETQVSGNENFPSEFGRGGIKVQGLISAIKSVYCSWDYIKLYIDEVTNNDPQFENWIKYNAHMGGKSPLADYIVQSYNMFVPKLSFLMYQTRGKNSNAQFHLYKNQNDANSIYLSATILYTNAAIEGKDEYAMEEIGDGETPLASLNMLIKATKTSQGIITTIEYANFTAHHPKIAEKFRLVAEEKKLQLIPTVKIAANKIREKEEQATSEKNMILRLQKMIASLSLDMETTNRLNADPITHIAEIETLHVDKQKAKQVSKQELEEKKSEIKESKQEKEDQSTAENKQVDEMEMADQALQKEVISQVKSLYGSGLDIKVLNDYLEHPLKHKEIISKLVQTQEELVDLLDKLQIAQEKKNRLSDGILANEQEIRELSKKQEEQELIRLVNTLKIDPLEKRIYLDNVLENKFEIKMLIEKQKDLLAKVSSMVLPVEIKSDFMRHPFIHQHQIIGKYIEVENKDYDKLNLIGNFISIASNRIDRLQAYVDACPDANTSQRARLFGAAVAVSEKKLAEEHMNYFQKLNESIAEEIKAEINALDKVDLRKLPYDILASALDKVIMTAKLNMLTLHEKGGGLRKDCYVALLMQYIEELEVDLFKCLKGLDAVNNSSTMEKLFKLIRPVNDPIHQMKEGIQNKDIAHNFQYIEKEMLSVLEKQQTGSRNKNSIPK